MQGFAEGLTVKMIAARMQRSPSTVNTTAYKAYKRLGVHDRSAALVMAMRAGWLRDPEALTAGQRLYLDAFDRYLAGPTRENRRRMTWMLGTLLYESESPRAPMIATLHIARQPLTRLLDDLLHAEGP